jgi:hypothetical protein
MQSSVTCPLRPSINMGPCTLIEAGSVGCCSMPVVAARFDWLKRACHGKISPRVSDASACRSYVRVAGSACHGMGPRSNQSSRTIVLPGDTRYVPLTNRLAAALREHRHLRSARVLCQANAVPLTQKIVQDHVCRSVRRAQLAKGGVHRLRHTFCSHLAMRGAPARAIQDLAGHQDLTTTQRYMHLSPAAIECAIRLLDSPGVPFGLGNRVATGSTEIANAPR